MPILRCAGLMLLAMLALVRPTQAQQANQVGPNLVGIVYLALTVKRVWPHSFLDQPPDDEGVQGARLALADNATTGRFLNQSYHLDEVLKPDADAVLSAFRASVAAGNRLFVVDVPAPLLVQLADLPEAKDSILIDATDTDDMLRAEGCRRNVLHMLPSRAMLADALMQYLVVKNWRNILLVVGQQPADQLYGDALRRSAQKFQIRLSPTSPGPFSPARAAPIPGISPWKTKSRASPRASATMCWSSPTRPIISATIPLYHTTDPRPSPDRQGIDPQRLGAGRSSNGARRNCRPLRPPGQAMGHGSRFRRMDGGARHRRSSDPHQQ